MQTTQCVKDGFQEIIDLTGDEENIISVINNSYTLTLHAPVKRQKTTFGALSCGYRGNTRITPFSNITNVVDSRMQYSNEPRTQSDKYIFNLQVINERLQSWSEQRPSSEKCLIRSQGNVLQSNEHTNFITPRNLSASFDNIMHANDEVLELKSTKLTSSGVNMPAKASSSKRTILRKPAELQIEVEYNDIGDPVHQCHHCKAFFWYAERLNARVNTKNPKYSGCCLNGKVILPPNLEPPRILRGLFYGNNEISKHFLENTRSYNSMFSFTSMGGKVDSSMNQGNSPPIFTICGQNYHQIGTLLPGEGEAPKFAQLYVYDTQNEIQNRMKSVRSDSSKNNLHERIVRDLKDMFDAENVLVKSFRMARDVISEVGSTNITLGLLNRRRGDSSQYTLPTIDEVATLIVGDINPALGKRDIVIKCIDGGMKRISELHPAYLALQYPILFPYGENGYVKDLPEDEDENDVEDCDDEVNRHTMREYSAYRLHERQGETSIMLHAKRLTQQFIVDLFTMIESNRLWYISTHQPQLRSELYSGVYDALIAGETDASNIGRRVILPSSFTGGARNMIQNYQDAMAICRSVGYPDLFLTFTCNPKWPEVARFLSDRSSKSEDRPDIIVRMFKTKLDILMKDIRKNRRFGDIVAAIYTVEFQKRGLPHAHILLFVDKNDKYPLPEDIDRIISAEIPDEKMDPFYYAAVRDFMVHGPCGHLNRKSPCMVDSRCTKHFPKKFIPVTSVNSEGYPVYRCRDSGRQIIKNGIPIDNTWIVPHNRYLLVTYGAHLNVEWCNQSRSIKYLFKYVNKGHDRVTAIFYNNSSTEEGDQEENEIKLYYDCRYLAPCEAAWRIFGYEIQYKDPPVVRLPFYLPNQQTVIFPDNDSLQNVVKKQLVRDSMYEGWFAANIESTDAHKYTYVEFPEYYVWKADIKKWKRRERGRAIGRLYYVHPGAGDAYYLRLLLNVQKGCKSHEDLKKVYLKDYSTYRDACYALGLLEDDTEYSDAIIQASFWATAPYLRNLFATLLSSDCLTNPKDTWEKCWSYLSDDFQHDQRILTRNEDLIIAEADRRNLALIHIDDILRKRGKTLKDYKGMPAADRRNNHISYDRFISEEMHYDRIAQLREFEELYVSLNDDQRQVYNTVMDAVDNNKGGFFFLYGYGGTGKTFVWKTLSASIRSRGGIVLNVASSGIAALLLPGGRTAHSRFKIPFNINEDSTCKISANSPLAHLIIQCELIIWDEAPMIHRHCFEALDGTLHDIMRTKNTSMSDLPFGGNTVVLGGDFRQILPVVQKGSRQDIVHASINSSFLWNSCKILKLTKNMRLQNCSSSIDAVNLEKFSKWIAAIGDGKLGPKNDGEVDIEIPPDILVNGGKKPVASMVAEIFPHYDGSSDDYTSLLGKAILAPTLDLVDEINEYMISLNQHSAHEYLSSDSPCQTEMGANLFHHINTPEFLNSIKTSGLPNHRLVLKVGTPVMLLRNIDHSLGLCNGTRMVITHLSRNVLEAQILTGSSCGDKVLLPRMILSPSDKSSPIRFQRRQFTIIVSYAMTINKSQGQSLSHVGIFLKHPVFSHGQLYVAISRVTNRSGLKILICDKDEKPCSVTRNVVYKEIFNNL